ncbi:MAG: DUF4198 domain-containing protein [Pseudomonadota bacterium]
MPHRALDPHINAGWRAVILVALLSAAPAQAHEFWIEPQHYRVAPGATVALRLFVGQDFKGDALIYLPELVERFVHVGPQGETSIDAVPGDDPAGEINVTETGLHRVAYRSKASSISFNSRDEFERYLDLEGLERIRETSDYNARTRPPIHELFSRCAKTLIGAGASPAGTDQPLGLRLELIAERNPYTPGDFTRTPVRLLLDGKPLAGALVKAFHHSDPRYNTRARTDAQGRALLDLHHPGVWLLNAVHLFPASAAAHAQWESLWASLTFQLDETVLRPPRASSDSNASTGSGRL